MTLPFNAIDALLAVIVLLGLWSGWGKGFVVATLQLLTLAASVVLAFMAYRYPAALLETHAPSLGAWIPAISFLATFILAQLLLGALAGRLVAAVPARVHGHGVNRGLGIFPGAVNGLINAAIVALLLLTMPVFDGLSTLARDSAIASRLSGPAEWLEARLAPIFHPAIQRTLQALTVQPESKTSVALPFKVAKPRARPDLEARMLDMVNAERSGQGLQPLKPDPEMTEVARAHSSDMFARGYFSHITPENQTPFDRMRQARVRFLVAGENLALAQSLAGAHQGLMNSPGHKANVLRPQFGRLGIGVLDGGMHGLMITQNFRN
jgi:uncharacterized protein YkwD